MACANTVTSPQLLPARHGAFGVLDRKPEGLPREAVRIAIAMPRQPDDFDVIERAEQPADGVDLCLETDDLGVVVAANEVDCWLAVAEYLQLAHAECPGVFDEGAQRLQFSFVVAAVTAGGDGVFGANAVRPFDDESEADTAGIRGGGAVEPGPPSCRCLCWRGSVGHVVDDFRKSIGGVDYRR